jgi:hypothetical protein
LVEFRAEYEEIGAFSGVLKRNLLRIKKVGEMRVFFSFAFKLVQKSGTDDAGNKIMDDVGVSEQFLVLIF